MAGILATLLSNSATGGSWRTISHAVAIWG
jgi:hypothetical protein